MRSAEIHLSTNWRRMRLVCLRRVFAHVLSLKIGQSSTRKWNLLREKRKKIRTISPLKSPGKLQTKVIL